MTRVNTIEPQDISDQALMAFYRELPMIHGALNRSLRKWFECGRTIVSADELGIPPTYRLNAGHVKFFYDKKQYLATQWNLLIKELAARKYNIDPVGRTVNWSIFDHVEQTAWSPDSVAHKINIDRLVERLYRRPDWYTYYGQPINVDKWVSYWYDKYCDDNKEIA